MTDARQRGFAAIELSAGIALLVLPVALLVLTLPQWSDRQNVARLAARDAARVVALLGWCDASAAASSVARVASDAGLDPSVLELALDCDLADPLPRRGSVTARVTVDMPLLAVPVVGSASGWEWTAGHREPVDPFGSRP